MKNKIYKISILCLIIDLFTKYLVKTNLNYLQVIKVIPGFFNLEYITNNGAAFGMFESKSYLLIIISFIVLIVLFKYINNEKNLSQLSSISLGLIMGGILGNLIERVLFKEVVDFLAFNILGFSFPVFNLADSFIVIGVIILIIGEMIKSDSR